MAMVIVNSSGQVGLAAAAGIVPYCYSEDAQDYRYYYGSLAPGESLDIDLSFCKRAAFAVGPGGAGFSMNLVGTGEFEVYAISPSGVNLLLRGAERRSSLGLCGPACADLSLAPG